MKKNDFLFEAIKIGNEVLEKAIRDEHGIYWKVKDHKEVESTGISFYNGNSGIVFFLLELYKKTKKEEFLEAINSALSWMISTDFRDTEQNLAFYCGAGGVAYTMVEAYKITGNIAYKNHALKVVREHTLKKNSDILYGNAGALLTLLHLHNEIQEEWIINEIKDRVTILLREVQIPKVGICWERSGAEIRSLCGFAHGGSGIAFVFLELYRYFNEKWFLKIAELAFEYEDYYFSREQLNWPDFRKDIYTNENFQKLVNAFTEKRYDEFTNQTFMSAWCHGAPGIGLARLHAFDITRKPRHLRYLNYAIENTQTSLNTGARGFTLCHGILGNASLFLEYYLVSKQKKFLNLARKEAEKSLIAREHQGYYVSGVTKVGAEADCDLFNGKSGIGHFYLRLSDPDNVCSAILPKLRRIHPTSIKPLFGDDFISNILCGRLFPNTANRTTIPFIGEIKRKNIIKAVGSFVNEENDKNLHNAFEMDCNRISIADSISSNNYFFIKERIDQAKYSENKFQRTILSEMFKNEYFLNTAVRLYVQANKNRNVYTLLMISPAKEPVQQITLSKFLYDILLTFVEKNTVENSFKIVIKNYYSLNQSAVNFAVNYKNQLRLCISKGFLVG